MGFRQLPSDRMLLTVFRDHNGRPLFMEVFDTRHNALRIMHGPGWDGRDKSRSTGPAAHELDIPEMIEHFMQEDQTFWRWPNPANKKLILMPNAFPWCEPREGDQLQDPRSRDVYTVRVVPPGRGPIPWAGTLLLNKEPDPSVVLDWIGEAKTRNYIDFHEEDGKPATPTPGEDTSGDTGAAWPDVVNPTITYLLETQRPGSIGAKPFGQRTEPKPRVREELIDPQSPQHAVQVYGQWMDNVFKFLCIHPRTIVAGHLARWFKGFMKRNTPSLKINGVPEILYWSQDPAQRARRGDDAAVREVRYYFRTEELEVRRYSTLRGVDFHLGVRSELEPSGPQRTGWEDLNVFTGSLYDASGHYAFADLDIADTRQTGASVW